MSKRAEYEIQCPKCEWFFKGEGRGPAHGDQEAINAAVAAWREHTCPNYILVANHIRFTGAQFKGLTDQISQLLPGVTFSVK